MSEAKSKFYAFLKILLAMIGCALVSLAIYLASVPFIYGAWHCPQLPCGAPDWMQWAVFAILLSPLLIFGLGAYLCRNVVFDLTQNLLWRTLLLAGFALFPLLVLFGLIASFILSK